MDEYRIQVKDDILVDDRDEDVYPERTESKENFLSNSMRSKK